MSEAGNQTHSDGPADPSLENERQEYEERYKLERSSLFIDDER